MDVCVYIYIYVSVCICVYQDISTYTHTHDIAKKGEFREDPLQRCNFTRGCKMLDKK